MPVAVSEASRNNSSCSSINSSSISSSFSVPPSQSSITIHLRAKAVPCITQAARELGRAGRSGLPTAKAPARGRKAHPWSGTTPKMWRTLGWFSVHMTAASRFMRFTTSAGTATASSPAEAPLPVAGRSADGEAARCMLVEQAAH